MKIETVTYFVCPECGEHHDKRIEAARCCDEGFQERRRARRIQAGKKRVQDALSGLRIRLVNRNAYDGDRIKVARAICPKCGRRIDVRAHCGFLRAKPLVRAQLARHLSKIWHCKR